jgi:hypothetical protein
MINNFVFENRAFYELKWKKTTENALLRFHCFENAPQRYCALLLAIFLIFYLTYQQNEIEIQLHKVLHCRRISLPVSISFYIVLKKK